LDTTATATTTITNNNNDDEIYVIFNDDTTTLSFDLTSITSSFDTLTKALKSLSQSSLWGTSGVNTSNSDEDTHESHCVTSGGVSAVALLLSSRVKPVSVTVEYVGNGTTDDGTIDDGTIDDDTIDDDTTDDDIMDADTTVDDPSAPSTVPSAATTTTATTTTTISILPTLTGLQLKSLIIHSLSLPGGFQDYYLRLNNQPFGSRTSISEHVGFKDGMELILEDVNGRGKCVGHT
jgi:hypothetical protein